MSRRAERVAPRAAPEDGAQPERQSRQIVITWNYRPSDWIGRVVGGIAAIGLLIWVALFSVLLALLLAMVIVAVLALLVYAVWRTWHASVQRPKAGAEERSENDGEERCATAVGESGCEQPYRVIEQQRLLGAGDVDDAYPIRRE